MIGRESLKNLNPLLLALPISSFTEWQTEFKLVIGLKWIVGVTMAILTCGSINRFPGSSGKSLLRPRSYKKYSQSWRRLAKQKGNVVWFNIVIFHIRIVHNFESWKLCSQLFFRWLSKGVFVFPIDLKFRGDSLRVDGDDKQKKSFHTDRWHCKRD